MPAIPYIRDKFTREVSHAREKAQDYLAQYPKDLSETEVAICSAPISSSP
jgi:hypothetical protein